MGISVIVLLVVNFAYLYQGKNLFANYFRFQFIHLIHVQDKPVFDLDYSSKEF